MIDARQAIIGKYKCYDYESITIADTAIGLTASKLTTDIKPKRAVITFETASCRYRYDGTNPTDTEGHLMYPTSILIIEGLVAMTNLKLIRTGTTSAVGKVSYER